MRVLCINAGSSSLKLALYSTQADTEKRLALAAAKRIGLPKAHLEVDGNPAECPLSDHQSALNRLLEQPAFTEFDAVGHRIVYGGNHSAPERLTADLRRRIESLKALAPLHIPPALAAIDAVTAWRPTVPQVACFDTAFHVGLPDLAQRMPLPERYHQRGIHRYGFHGLSYEYIVRRLGERVRGRVIVAHLGNGSSLAALLDGRSVETTMGMTPIGGVMMGTRSGDLDPGVLIHLLRTEHLDADALERLLEFEAGLLGVSGTTSDMEKLLAAAPCDPAARLAVDLYAYSIRKAIGALSAVLGGLDRLVFTAGIGENAPAVRWNICRNLEYLGIRLDPHANDAGTGRISALGSTCEVEVIATDEDAMIARHTRSVLYDNSRFGKTLDPH